MRARRLSMWGGLCLLISGLETGVAWGLEGTTPTGPIGGSDIRVALMPPPGLYGALVGVGDPIGNVNTPSGSLPASGAQYIGGAGLLYVYDARLFGGSLASSISDGYSQLCFGLKVVNPKPCVTGTTDIYSDVLMWNLFIPNSSPPKSGGGILPIPYGLSIQFGLGVSFPNGAYQATRPVNLGSNFFDIAPNVALTYTVPSIFGPALGQATEFSVRPFFHYYTENPATGYHTAPIASVDFAITQRWDNWQFGLAGTTFAQLREDELNGVGVSGSRAAYVGLGPVVSYDFRASDRIWNVTFKAIIGTTSKNFTEASGTLLRLSTKLF